MSVSLDVIGKNLPLNLAVVQCCDCNVSMTESIMGQEWVGTLARDTWREKGKRGDAGKVG